MRWIVAAKTAVAASIALGIAYLIPGPGSEYPYYAPLGAVAVMSSTVAGTVRDSIQTIAAIAIGAAIATTALVMFPDQGLWVVPVVVGLGVLAAGWFVLGGAGSWAPTSALFILIAGHGDPADYVAGYLGLTALGATIATVLNLVVPPSPLASFGGVALQARGELADQLDELADALSGEDAPSASQWLTRTRSLGPVLFSVRQAAQATTEARRGNFRARRHSAQADYQFAAARELEQLTFLVLDLSSLITEGERLDKRVLALGPRLRPVVAQSLTGLARVLRSYDELHRTINRAEFAAAHHELRRLWQQLTPEEGGIGSESFHAVSVAVGIRRCLVAVHRLRA